MGDLGTFDAQIRTRIVFGPGEVSKVGPLARELHAEHVLLVTDEGLVQAGHADRVQQLLEDAGCHVQRYAEVHENPTSADVEDCASAVQRPVDLIVGLGGGSSIDTAKGTSFLLTNSGRMEDYQGYGKASQPLLPLVAIPTTTGTGTETQSFALVSAAKTHEKMACGDPGAAPRVAILDPQLASTQPRRVAAVTGLDLLTHSVETFVTTKRHSLSQMFSREAFVLTNRAYPRILEGGEDSSSWGELQLAAAYAGMAIELSMLGAAHGLANPLTARFGVTHGHAVGLMLPHVMGFNAQDPQTRREYQELASAAGLASLDANEAADRLRDRVEELLSLSGFPRSLHDCGVAAKDIEELAELAVRQWTAQFNPRPLKETDARELYRAALEPSGT